MSRPAAPKEVREYLAKIGAKGGKKGGKTTGESKVRGDAEYYRAISQKAVQARTRSAAILQRGTNPCGLCLGVGELQEGVPCPECTADSAALARKEKKDGR